MFMTKNKGKINHNKYVNYHLSSKNKKPKYCIYFQVSKFTKSKYHTKGWKDTKKRLEWFKRKGLKAYAKRLKHK